MSDKSDFFDEINKNEPAEFVSGDMLSGSYDPEEPAFWERLKARFKKFKARFKRKRKRAMFVVYFSLGGRVFSFDNDGEYFRVAEQMEGEGAEAVRLLKINLRELEQTNQHWLYNVEPVEEKAD